MMECYPMKIAVPVDVCKNPNPEGRLRISALSAGLAIRNPGTDPNLRCGTRVKAKLKSTRTK